MSFDKIVVIGADSENPSKFRTSFPPLKLDTKHELCLTSMFYAPIFNITDKNNVLTVNVILDPVNYSVKLKNGSYKTKWALLSEIVDKVRQANQNNEISPHKETVTFKKVKSQITVVMPYTIMGDCLNMLGVTKFIGGRNYTFMDDNVMNTPFPAFLYCNIVEVSWINNKLSRLLQVIPLEYNQGWSYLDFHTQEKLIIALKEFSNIIFEIKDINGDFIPFNPDLKTIMSFKITSINS